MKHLLFIFLTSSLLLQAGTSTQKQSFKDLLNHFASEAYYREIFRCCTYYIDDPNPEIITYALNLLQSQDRALLHLIKDAWQQYGTTLLTQAEKKFNYEKEQNKELLALLVANNSFSLLKNGAYFNLKSLETFNTWLSVQK